MGTIPLFHHVARRYRLRETGPASAAIEFIQRAKQRLAGNNIDVNSCPMIVPVRVVKRSFRPAFTRDAILVFGQFFLQVRIAGHWLGWIHFLSFLFLRLSISKENRAGNHNDRPKQAKPQRLMRPMMRAY